MKKGWYRALPEGLLNASVIAGIATLSMWAGADIVSGKAIGLAFGIPFLLEFRKFLDLNKR